MRCNKNVTINFRKRFRHGWHDRHKAGSRWLGGQLILIANRPNGEYCGTMKNPDIAESLIVKKFGACGARRFAWIWFAAMYAMLTASTAGFWIFSPEFTDTLPRVILGSLIAVLVVSAASLLTRMHLEFFAGIQRLEVKPSAA
jgi:hypothetical protein